MLPVPLVTILDINETILQIYSQYSFPTSTEHILIALSFPVGSVKLGHERNPFVQWPIAEPWTSILVPMITRMIFEWTFGYHVMFPLLRDTLQNPVCIGILQSHHHAHYSVAPVTSFVLLFRWRVSASPWCSHLCLATRCWMPSHREGPKNISPSSKEQIPLLSYLVTCQTFRWTSQLSL